MNAPPEIGANGGSGLVGTGAEEGAAGQDEGEQQQAAHACDDGGEGRRSKTAEQAEGCYEIRLSLRAPALREARRTPRSGG